MEPAKIISCSNQLVSCQVCENTQTKSFYKRDNLKYVICKRCGFVYLNPRPTQHELSNFYSSAYQKSRHKISDLDSAIERLKQPGRYDRKLKRAKEFKEILSKQSKVFEVGSGYGTLLAAVKELYDCQVDGVEPSNLGSKVASSFYKINTNNETFELFIKRLSKKTVFPQYNLILMVHALEHFDTPSEILKFLQKILSDDGFLYIAVPNICSPDEPPDRFFHHEHLSYFSPYTLIKILENEGFTVVALEEREKELVVFATKRNVPGSRKTVSSADYADITPEKIETKIRKYKNRYAILRSFRHIVQCVFPEKILRLIQGLVAKILRKIKFI